MIIYDYYLWLYMIIYYNYLWLYMIIYILKYVVITYYLASLLLSTFLWFILFEVLSRPSSGWAEVPSMTGTETGGFEQWLQ